METKNKPAAAGKCLNCGKEVESKGTKPRLFCSDACRMKHKRAGQTNKTEQTNGILEEAGEENEQGLAEKAERKTVDTKLPPENMTMTPEGLKEKVPDNYGLPNCTCRHCRANRNNKLNLTINHGAFKAANALVKNEVNRVSLPGDIDYHGAADELLKRQQS